jgi:hypothetical protein
MLTYVMAEVEHFVQSALDGYNVSLLAYGQVSLLLALLLALLLKLLVYEAISY